MKGEEMVIPHLFRCPISLDLFKDPVTLSTGQTYDRIFIEKWLSEGNATCPVTMQKLDDSSIVPNHTLRHLIHEWIIDNSEGQFEAADDEENDVSIGEFKRILESNESTLDDKILVLDKVHSLSEKLPLENSRLIEFDFFGLLSELVFEIGTKSLKFVEKALFCALKLMPFSEMESLNKILEQETKYVVFLLLFEQGNISIKKSLCLVVEAISSCVDTKNLGEKLGKSDKLLRGIVDVVQNKSEANEAGVRALSSLSRIEKNRENLDKQGAVKGLIAYLSNVEIIEKGSLAPMAVSTIENLLLSVGSAKIAILDNCCGVKAIVKMVFRVSNHEGSESAVNCLVIVCSDSKIARETAIVEGVLTQLLLLLQSQCSARIKTKARMLLKLLRTMWINEDLNNGFGVI
ncbi:hypothetical protein MIMGU_mgv1a007556mg [Erythranthe guttata]|uniref:U-box domain-containing protein n=1 Tax=Erythranthe guttata TaxID=4155 RepID=A0A022QPA4_ERYGU|nr:PREDICTED: U-box domain-containing protein 26-like [Erythranthe guttata]EYU30497.1 hypothetical protein MIMGU_mgv1a007556mg [Erythranthe guttata]|eukprot:XP_012845669.1 PREDICTED: U-box domain-containing protein 26-like [Erythranthe guttata]